MKITHDFHIHTNLSACANETATLENYLVNARKFGLTKLGFSDHLWDDRIAGAIEWYQPQNVSHLLKLKDQISKVNEEDITLFWGCEAEYDLYHHGVALTEEAASLFDFIIVPNSHTHMMMPKEYYFPSQKHADFMLQAYREIIASPVSRYITAIAHPFHAVGCKPYDYRILFDLITDDEYKRIFDSTAEKEIAIEINMDCMKGEIVSEIELNPEMRMFRLAKECGCKFIFGSDAHSSRKHDNYYRAELVADLLELGEEDIAEIAR